MWPYILRATVITYEFHQELVIYNERAIIWAFKNAMAHGPDYLGLKAAGSYMEPLFHNIGQIFDELMSLHVNLCWELVI